MHNSFGRWSNDESLFKLHPQPLHPSQYSRISLNQEYFA
jgi:hypothetical protein